MEQVGASKSSLGYDAPASGSFYLAGVLSREAFPIRLREAN
jgi:hypothetical protein